MFDQPKAPPRRITAEALQDGLLWFSQTPTQKIRLTVFVVTIGGPQISSALSAINDLNEVEPVLFHVVKDVTPASKAYDEMRRRCTTPFFVQLDEDMELHPEAISILTKAMDTWSDRMFVTYYLLIDDVLGIGNPSVIHSLKLYCTDAMRGFPCHSENTPVRSSIDGAWHKQLEAAGYWARAANQVIGNHGRTRSLFDLFLRYCKTTASLLNPAVKTHSGHVCILLRALGVNRASKSLCIVMPHFRQFARLEEAHFEKLLQLVNTWVPAARLDDYGLPRTRPVVTEHAFSGGSQWAYEELYRSPEEDIHSIVCAVAMFCAVTNNYVFSAKSYPREIYEYFIAALKYQE